MNVNEVEVFEKDDSERIEVSVALLVYTIDQMLQKML
jgi:hypothetical protein